jgi:hypothetical protein
MPEVNLQSIPFSAMEPFDSSLAGIWAMKTNHDISGMPYSLLAVRRKRALALLLGGIKGQEPPLR